ncbi:MAG: hypothetical protein ACO3ZD_06640, partial [Cyanobium sp.]
GQMMQIAELKLYGSQSGSPASILGGLLSATGAVGGETSEDPLIAFVDNASAMNQFSMHAQKSQGDGIIHAEDFGLRQIASWPTHALNLQEIRALSQPFRSAFFRFPSAFHDPLHEEQGLRQRGFPMVGFRAENARPYLLPLDL